jgi:hypothetical protein
LWKSLIISACFLIRHSTLHIARLINRSLHAILPVSAPCGLADRSMKNVVKPEHYHYPYTGKRLKRGGNRYG